MIRVYLLLEGQTEEAFVKELLLPYYGNLGIHLVPIVVSTSPGHKGGRAKYSKIKQQLHRLCKERGAHVTTLFDLYALPKDFPGMKSPLFPHAGNGKRKAEFLETELAKDVSRENFIPHLLVHEFEALLFVQVDAFTTWVNDGKTLEPLRKVRKTTAPEDINDSPQTAPSKRILEVMANYQKTFHGPLIACDIGLDAISRECPHFSQWLIKIEALSKTHL